MIVGLEREAASDEAEFLPATDREVLKFLEDADPAAVQDAIRDSDAEFARVTEDLIHLLVRKQVILFTELPEIVQKKLLAREQLRARLNPAQPSLISEDDTI